MSINLEDFNKYYIIQIWNDNDPEANNLESFVKQVAKELSQKNNAKIVCIDGPTYWLPDFFSELYGHRAGYLLSIERDVNPYDLKKTCMELEKNDKNKRICDIDVYIENEISKFRDCNGKECTSSYLKSLHRKDRQLEKFKEHRRLNDYWNNNT